MKRASLAALLLFAACQSTPDAGETPTPGAVIVETMDSGGYTYVKLEDGSWHAVRQTEVVVGDRVVIDAGAMKMQNFKSNTLDRTFPVIFFASGLQKVGGE